jgi:hypothetical protein
MKRHRLLHLGRLSCLNSSGQTPAAGLTTKSHSQEILGHLYSLLDTSINLEANAGPTISTTRTIAFPARALLLQPLHPNRYSFSFLSSINRKALSLSLSLSLTLSLSLSRIVHSCLHGL